MQFFKRTRPTLGQYLQKVPNCLWFTRTNLNLHNLLKSTWIFKKSTCFTSCFFSNASQTDGQTGRPIDGPTDPSKRVSNGVPFYNKKKQNSAKTTLLQLVSQGGQYSFISWRHCFHTYKLNTNFWPGKCLEEEKDHNKNSN